jgi:hypothetical protein
MSPPSARYRQPRQPSRITPAPAATTAARPRGGRAGPAGVDAPATPAPHSRGAAPSWHPRRKPGHPPGGWSHPQGNLITVVTPFPGVTRPLVRERVRRGTVPVTNRSQPPASAQRPGPLMTAPSAGHSHRTSPACHTSPGFQRRQTLCNPPFMAFERHGSGLSVRP